MQSNDENETEHHYRVCCWCGNDSIDDPRIIWEIKHSTKRIGLCTACEREVPVEWIQLTDEDDDENHQ
jgi:hypothetical protein